MRRPGALALSPASRHAAPSRLVTMLGPPALVALCYYIGCLAGFALRFPASGISFFWPPTAVLAAALILTPPSSWAALLGSSFVAHAVAHAQDGVPIGAWPIQFLGNGVQAIIAAFILRRSGATQLFADARRALVFVVGACALAPAVASLIPAYVYVTLGWAADFAQAWRARAVGNAVASLTLLPLFVAGWRWLSARPMRVPSRLDEYVVLLVGSLAAHAVSGSIERTDVLGLTVALYAPAPFLFWAAVRFGGVGVSFALLWTTLLTISNVAAGHGPLAAASPADTVVGVQLLIAANAVPMILIAGLFEEIRAEHRALVDVERQNSAILRALPDLTFLQTRAGVYLRCYAGSADVPAVRPESFVGRHMRHVLPPHLAGTFAHLFRTVTAETASVIEYTQVVDGVPRRYEGRFIAVDRDRVLSVVRDITQRWQSENALRETQQRYALATAAGGIGVWELDTHTGRVCVEGGLKAILGYGHDEIGDRLNDWVPIVHPADQPGVDARLALFASGASDGFEAEFRMIHKDGSFRWIASKGAVTDRVDGRPARIRGTYMDVTERKEAARALHEAQDALVRTGRIAAMSEFSASIAHELRQPLTAIAANANACLRSIDAGIANVDIRPALRAIVAGSRQASHIAERTQEMFTSHPEERDQVDLNASVRSILEIAGTRLRERSVTLDLDLADDLPRVSADPVQMQQVLLNLVVNGVEAMDLIPERARVLRIDSRRRGGAVVVSVRDRGKGFGVEHPARVFEPFYTTKAAGVGMGLTICRSIITSHGGSLWAVANVDRGATFRVKLPALAGARRMVAARRVLVVDDHAPLRRSLSRLLRAWGHRVATAASGRRALAIAQTFQPDYAVLDLSLRDMTGLDIARHLRDEFPVGRLHLVALTARLDDDVRAACLNGGFDTFLVKPSGIAELERVLTPGQPAVPRDAA